MGRVGGGEDVGALRMHALGAAVVHHGGRQESEAAVIVVVVVPAEEVVPERPAICQGTQSVRETLGSTSRS